MGKDICFTFCFRREKTTLKTHEMLRTDVVKNTMGRKQTFERGFERKLGKTRLKFVTVLVVFPRVSQKETWAQFAKSSTKTEEYHFGDGWQDRSPARNRPMDSRRGQKNSAVLHEVCTSVFH